MGRASELGTVEPGKRADLLVLDADPQSDISMHGAFIAWFGEA